MYTLANGCDLDIYHLYTCVPFNLVVKFIPSTIFITVADDDVVGCIEVVVLVEVVVSLLSEVLVVDWMVLIFLNDFADSTASRYNAGLTYIITSNRFITSNLYNIL